MYVRRGHPALLPLLFAVLTTTLLSGFCTRAEAQLFDGIEHFADSMVGLSSGKWGGARVPFPPPRLRPAASQRVDSADWPVSVHAGPGIAAGRLAEVLAAAEATHALLAAAGFLTSFGDAGQGGTGGRDLYLLDATVESASSALDATGNFTALDGARAYALLDARLPADRFLACTAQALIDAQLFELDPAESADLRRASAAYFASLLSGELCDDPQRESAANPFLSSAADGAGWLARLSERQDQNRGTFLFDMWQFARQRTWEGQDLRASPDLMEAIDRALALHRESFALVASELSEGLAHERLERVRKVSWQELPAFSAKSDPPLGVLGSKQLLVQVGSHAGSRLRAWARGEAGGRYVLSAQCLDQQGKVLARLELEPRRDPVSQLSIELDRETVSVLVSVLRYADEGVPDPDRFSVLDTRPVSLTVDSQ